MFIESIKFIIYSLVIVFISKAILAPTIRALANALSLKPKTVGNISGYATSMPELLTILASSTSGLLQTSIYNVVSSNIINFVQYIVTIICNKNIDKLKNRGIVVNLILSVITIFIPIFVIKFNITSGKLIVPVFSLLFILFNYIINNAHKLYLKNEDNRIEEENLKKLKKGKLAVVIYIVILVIVIFFLFIVGEYLGDTLEILCGKFNVPEIVVGALLGFITSIPELMTFFESQKHYQISKNKMLGVVEATNNLVSSNMLNLFVIQSIGIILFWYIQ